MKCDRQCVYLLLQVISLTTNCLAENLILNINFKKPIAITDHAFLSFTLDPTTLQNNDFIKNFERSTNLARGLAPAYIRLGGPQNNFLNFEQAYSHKTDTDLNDMYFGTQWTLLHQWAKNAGLDIIVCISPYYIDNESKTDSKDPRNIAELLSFSDRMGYNISWQLGYECQTRCDLSGGELGRYVSNLREILKTFPRYSNSLITGPDIVAHRTTQQQKYIQDYLHSANSALSAITWHPDLNSVSLNNDNISIHDNMIADKDEIYKIINHTAVNKPLWIAESKPEENKHQYLGALIWTRRLGNAAKLGIQVVMRQLSDLFHATPTYWVSLLYKTLVGPEVLEMTLQSENESHVYFYSQCTKTSALYSKGAVTIFGINLTSRKIIASLRNLKIKILHKYILSSDFEINNKMFSEKVLLNNKSLHLINDKELPDINPEIIINPNGLELELPSGGIGFWVIPNAKVKACICSEEETIENNLVKKLSKRHESDVRQDDQKEKEENINQSNIVDNDVKENINQSTLKNQKIYENQNRKKQNNIENIKTENQQRDWKSKLLVKIKRILQKQLQRKDRSEPKRSFIIDLGEKQENSFEEVGVQQNLDKRDFKKTEDDKFENIRDILKKYKCILLQKKAEMETEGIQDLKSEIQHITNIVGLISKLDDFLPYKVTSNETIMSEIKNKIKNEGESIIKINKKLKEYLIELEKSVEKKSNIIRKIEKYFNKLYNLLENDDSVKDKNNQVFIHEDLVKAKRFKRHLDRKLENSKKIRIFKKRSEMNNLKDYMIKQKINWKNDDKKELLPPNNLKKKLNNNEKKYNLLQRDSMKRFLKNNAFEKVAHHIDYQNLVQEQKRIENGNIYRKYSKIGDMEKYQGLQLVQEPERTKREINKKLVELGLKKDSVFKKRLRIDELKNYLNEKKTKQKNDIRREGLLVPFNPRIANSDENNFYGFFRREPVKGFPKGDIFVTTGDSLEQKNKDYDYVDDEDDDNDDSERKNTLYNQKSMLDHKDTWVSKEVEDDHCDNMPNEFFENVKSSNTKIKENPKNYEDLWEAEFPSVEHNNNKNNNNNKITIAEIVQEQPLNEKKEKRVRETSMLNAQIVNYNDDIKKQEYDRDTLRLASKYSSMPFDQLFKTPNSNINYQTSNMELRDAKLKLKPETEISNSFYLPSQVSTARYNYDNYQTSNINHDKIKLKDEKDFSMNIGNRNNIDAKAAQYSTSTSVYAEQPIYDKSYHNERNKRSNWEELRNVFAEEMIKEDEGNGRDCHCRVIRASDLPKKLDYHRNKREISVPVQFMDTSFENKNVNTDVAQSKENDQISVTEEEYEEIIAGEILPSTSIIEIVSEEIDTTTESVISESSTLDHKVGTTTQAIDLTSISGMNTISEQYNDMKKSDINEPVNSTSEISLNNNNSNESITNETFFRGQSVESIANETFFRGQPDESENEAKTYDPSQVIYKIPSEYKGTPEELLVSVTKNPQETYEKSKDLINEKEKADSSIYSTITENQKNKEGYNSDYKIGLEPTNFFQEISKEITEQVSTESILSKEETSTANNNAKSNESETNTKLLQNIEDNQNSESKLWMEKNANTRKLKTILRNLPRASLEELTRHEDHLMRRAEQINKQREKLHARRQKLLYQYQNELTKIANEQKRNLQRRETWEKLHENDDFRRLIDGEAIIEVLLNDDVIFEDDDENDLIPIELVSKQDKNIIDQIYLLVKAKKIKRYPEHNKYYQFLQNLIEDNEELADTSKSSEHKYNQYNDYILKVIKDKQKSEASKFLDREHSQDHQNSSKTIKDERESTETMSRSFDRKIFIIEPSTYYDDEPILQSNEDLKLPKYHSKIKFQIEDPISKWILKNPRQVFSRFKSSEDQHQASRSQEYVKKLPIEDYYDQGNANILYVLDTPKQHDLQKELDALAQVWLSSLDRRDINQAMNEKETDELNNIYKNLKADKDNLDLILAVNKKTEDFETEENMKNKEFISSNNKKEDTINSETTEDANKKVTKTKKSETVELTKQEEINKSFYNLNSNDKAKNNLNIKISNNNKDGVEKIIDDDLNAMELEKENIRVRRDIEKLSERLPHFRIIKIEDMRNKFINHNRILLKKEFFKKIINDQPILLLTKNNIPLSAGLSQKSKNHLVSSKKNFIDDEENEKEESNYIILIPIEIKNIYDMLDAKDNDDSSGRFDISAQSDDQSVFKKISDLLGKDLNDEASEESEYEDLSNLQSENIENIPDDESLYENEQDVSAKDSEAESEEDELYEITSNESNKYLKIRNQVGSNKRGMFLLLPWRNMKKRQRRHIRNEISKDTVGIKREVTRHSQSNSILAEDFKNEHTKKYFENNIDQEEEENIIETNDEKINYLKSPVNRKNRDNLLEDFIKARKKNNLYHNKVSSLENTEKNEIIPLNNITKNNKKLLQEEAISELRNHKESIEKLVDDSKKNFNDTLALDEDKHYRNRTCGITGNAFYTAIMNIKDFFAFFSKISHMFMNKF